MLAALQIEKKAAVRETRPPHGGRVVFAPGYWLNTNSFVLISAHKMFS